ncbi:hypothetical protein Cfor_05694 [Coptotermes formosanus]|uniref:RRM domain-containing protein n=1 Tax=Coptotermes formosanus TaxID=36987 RepID=A0A6L2Q6E9_COPFO|nr:hypothetical protein Cfor_05694 [Coptotermes formosanus]
MDDERTVWCGNLSEKVTEEVLYELFLQAGPLERVKIPKDNNGRQRNYGFITFKHVCSVPYSVALFAGTSLFNKVLQLNSRSTDIDSPQGQASISYIHNSGRHRTQSLPINFGSMAAAAVPDYNMLLQLGQQMLIPGSFGSEQCQLNQYNTSASSNSLPLYRSQMNSSYYLGGDLQKISKTNHNNNGNKRHHPYAPSSGSRDHENIHNSNSHQSNSKSGRHRHDRHDNDRRHSGGRRRR